MKNDPPTWTLETRLWDELWNCLDCRIQHGLEGTPLKKEIAQSVEDYRIHTGIFDLPGFKKSKVKYLTLEVTHDNP